MGPVWVGSGLLVGEARQLFFASPSKWLASAPPSHGFSPSQSQGLHSHHIVSQHFCLCWYPEHSTEDCGHRMAPLHVLPQVGSHRVKIEQFCFATTAASMVTACDITGKAICRLLSWKEGDKAGEDRAGVEEGRSMPVLKGVIHIGPLLWSLSCHFFWLRLSESRCS